MKLHIGSKDVEFAGYLSIDKNAMFEPDILWDVEMPPPLCIKEGSVEEILCYNVLEHCNDPFGVLQRFHVICKHGALIKIRVPYYNSVTAAGDLTHRSFFGFTSFDCLNEYGSLKFEIISIEGEPGFVGKFLPRKLRRYLSYYIGNLVRALNITLRVVK